MQAILQNPFLKYLYGFLPKLTTVILATVCFAIGMVFAYATISFVDGDPRQLEQSWQDQWVISTEARFRAANNQAAAEPGNIVNLLAAVDNPQEIVERLGLGNGQFQQLAQQAQEQAPSAPRGGTILSNYVMPIVWIIVFAIIYTLLFFVWSFVIFPFIRDLTRQEDEEEKAAAAAEIQKIKDIKAQEEAMRAEASSSEGSQLYGEPVIQKISQYQRGFGKYDDSFNIETEDKTYYGEAGGSIAEQLGEDGVTAIEVWMFDKDEFTNTPNTILASQHAFNDPAIKSRLEPKGEVVLAEPGQVIKLETNALYVEAKVTDVQYDPSAEIPNSEFSKVTTQITAWAKNADTSGGGGTPSPGGAPPMPTPDFNAPTQPASPVGSGGQSSPQPPSDPFGGSGGFQPPSQPSGGGSSGGGQSNPPPPDDPFGGTGDFTPVNPDR